MERKRTASSGKNSRDSETVLPRLRGMNGHALTVLGFHGALEQVAGHATSEAGRAAVLSLRPHVDRDWVERELTRVSETEAFLKASSTWSPLEIPDCLPLFERLAIEGSVLDGVELYAVGVSLVSGGQLTEALDAESFEALAFIRARLHTDPNLETRIAKTTDDSGEILDTASPDIRRIRKQLRGSRNKIVRKLEAFVANLPERVRVADASVGVRDGRYVVPVRREGKRDVGGIVHDESHTGGTLFVEPPMAIELTNELRALEREETREIHRVLSEITQTLRPLHPSLTASWEALVEFDSLAARAQAASEWGACRPALSGESEGWMIVRGRHPLLLANSDDPVVPFDLSLESGERIVVVSGPNTGGKSVFLKAVGLIASLTQSGVVPPVEEGTRLPIFDSIFADIGDEQSIMENLSTFSAHLTIWKEVVESAGKGSLVLLDEMGTGTDPAEGAALSQALIEHLSQRGATAVVTSHLGALKRLDTEGSGVVNAALQFDPDGMKPTYELVKGRPGRSYGLATAHRLGLPAHVLERAESHMEGGDASMEDLLARLEKKEKEALELVGTLSREREETAGLRAEVEAREADLRHTEREAERRAREEARRILMEARQEVEEAIREVREASSAKELENAARSSRQRVEDAARRQKELRPGGRKGSGSATFTPGDRVRLLDGGLKGVVAEVRDDRVVIDASGIRMKAHVADLELVNQGEGAQDTSAGSVLWKAPDGPVHTEVDLRGLRVDEVDQALLRSIDAAILGELTELRIIHGKGTGAVRARVTTLLEDDGRVSAFRVGERTEGGAGVTVASLEGC
jgi:DNA mismatch repair protein MutS2